LRFVKSQLIDNEIFTVYPSKEITMSATPKSEILNLVSLVDYQPGAIVSRQILKSDNGNITLFAFGEGQELSEHTAPFDALVHVLEGKTEVKISSKPFLLQAGDAILMPANDPHALKAVSNFKMLLTMIK
jgi:quercetin dioxygenase-like cupin family protein